MQFVEKRSQQPQQPAVTAENEYVLKPRHIIGETALLSIDDDPATQEFKEYDLVCYAVQRAAQTKLARKFTFGDVFPGDHYRLLAGLMSVLQCREICDIGTANGFSAQVFLDHAHPFAKVTTFDITPYTEFSDTTLTDDDFSSGRLVQILRDLKDPETFNDYIEYFNSCDFIMCDGPKDGEFEYKFLDMLSQVPFTVQPRWLFLDDIRFGNMLGLWRMIRSPKIDLTSFGHFSGSGLVNISEGLRLTR